jgi:hypothetical protein
MMFVDPFRMVVVPPSAVAPHVMLVPITVISRMRDRRRSREEGSQGSGGEYCSKVHSQCLLDSLTRIIRGIDNASFKRTENRQESVIFADN